MAGWVNNGFHFLSFTFAADEDEDDAVFHCLTRWHRAKRLSVSHSLVAFEKLYCWLLAIIPNHIHSFPRLSKWSKSCPGWLGWSTTYQPQHVCGVSVWGVGSNGSERMNDWVTDGMTRYTPLMDRERALMNGSSTPATATFQFIFHLLLSPCILFVVLTN